MATCVAATPQGTSEGAERHRRLPMDTTTRVHAGVSVVAASLLLAVGAALLAPGRAAAWVAAPPAAGEQRAAVAAATYNCAAATGVSQVECAALVALYNSTNGPGWTDQGGWLQGTEPCTWLGVTCENGHVVALQLTRNGLAGPIPSEIGDLVYLAYLTLDHGALTGPVPASIGNLTRLIQLELDNNQLTSLPPQIGNLTQLETLDVDTNLLTVIPPQLGNLKKLTFLDMDTNRIAVGIPPEVGTMTALANLDLKDNPLTGSIPFTLGNLTNLRVLDLGNTHLSGGLPQALTQLTLNSFNFEGTDLCEPTDAAFQAWLAGIPFLDRTGVLCTMGGKNARLTAGSAALQWSSGNQQNGYRVFRFNAATGASSLLPEGPALPAAATGYIDGAATPNTMYCYAVAPVDSLGFILGLSDILCTMHGTAGGSVQPGSFTLALNQSNMASMTWVAPAGGATSYTLLIIPLDSSPVTTVTLAGSATSTTHDTKGVYHCYALLGHGPGGAIGYTDPVCGLPGMSTVNAAGFPAGEPQLQQAAGGLRAVQMVHNVLPRTLLGAE